MFEEQKFKNASEYILRVEKVSRRKKDVFVKWKEYDDNLPCNRRTNI